MPKDKNEPAVTAVCQESVYAADEIAANATRLFGCSVDIARAALAFNHVETCTINEAKRLIREFAERKV